MSVVNVNSTQLANLYSTPPVRNNSYLSGGQDWEMVDFCTAGASDSAGSTYRFFGLPSNARIIDIQIQNDANTAGTSYKCGVLLPNGGGVVVASSDAIFFSTITMASARSVWTSLHSPVVAGGSYAVANVNKRIWELLGLTADPNATYEVAISAVTPGTAGGNMALRCCYSR